MYVVCYVVCPNHNLILFCYYYYYYKNSWNNNYLFHHGESIRFSLCSPEFLVDKMEPSLC